MDEGEAGGAHYTFDFEYDKEKSGEGQESKKKYLSRVKSTLRIVLQVRKIAWPHIKLGIPNIRCHKVFSTWFNVSADILSLLDEKNVKRKSECTFQI